MTTAETPRLFVNTFGPLICSRLGKIAASDQKLAPFIDGSIRREPDFEHPQPMISCLCRAGKFVPRLRAGDVVLYLTTKGRYGRPERHWRLAAILRVERLLDSHAHAARWYADQGMDLPSNCMVAGNEAKPLSHSHQRTPRGGCMGEAQLHRWWDAAYRKRARDYPRVVICRRLFCNVSWGAPVVHDDDLVHAFGEVPGTQNPGARPMAGLTRLLRRLSLPELPSSP